MTADTNSPLNRISC